MLLLSTASHVKLVNPASEDMSDISFSLIFSHVKLVNPASEDMSDIELLPRCRCFNPVKLASGESFDILFW